MLSLLSLTFLRQGNKLARHLLTPTLISELFHVLFILWCKDLYILVCFFGESFRSVESLKDVFKHYCFLLLLNNLSVLLICFCWRLVNPLSEDCEHECCADEQFRDGFVQRLIGDWVFFLLCVEVLFPEIVISLLSQLFIFCLHFFPLIFWHFRVILLGFFCQLFIIQFF